jgi:hypothetical protein
MRRLLLMPAPHVLEHSSHSPHWLVAHFCISVTAQGLTIKMMALQKVTVPCEQCSVINDNPVWLETRFFVFLRVLRPPPRSSNHSSKVQPRQSPGFSTSSSTFTTIYWHLVITTSSKRKKKKTITFHVHVYIIHFKH